MPAGLSAGAPAKQTWRRRGGLCALVLASGPARAPLQPPRRARLPQVLAADARARRAALRPAGGPAAAGTRAPAGLLRAVPVQPGPRRHDGVLRGGGRVRLGAGRAAPGARVARAPAPARLCPFPIPIPFLFPLPPPSDSRGQAAAQEAAAAGPPPQHRRPNTPAGRAAAGRPQRAPPAEERVRQGAYTMLRSHL